MEQDILKVNSLRAIQLLELGFIIQSLLSDREIKKVNGDYYWCRDVEGSKYREWRVCKLDEGLITSGEMQSNWYAT